MLVPPVAQNGPGGRQVVGDVGGMRTTQGPGATATLWPIAPAHSNLSSNHQSQATPPLGAAPAPAHNQGLNRFELYSLFPGAGGGSYVAASPGPPAATPPRTFHATTHKVSESMFSAAVGVGVGGYTWGAPTPPPGSPYSPVPVTQLELLAKNLANLTPHHAQQPMSLQGVGVNVGTSLHHSQHTTQHTLNLAGLHHLHHGESTMTTTSATSFTTKFIDERTFTLGGIHQGTFSPQLSLVTGTPTLTINSFTTPNSQCNIVQPNGSVLLHDYQSSNGQNNLTTCTPSSVSLTTLPTTACSVSTMMLQDGQNTNTYLQSTMKKRESFVTAQAQIKVENTTTTRQSCVCKSSNLTGKTKIVHTEAGCSRTLPVVSSWNNQDLSTTSIIKREPLTTTVPCQVAEVSTSLHATTTEVKIEPLTQKTENGIVVSTAAGTSIPVGIAVARQRLQHQETSSTSMRNVSLSHHTSHASYHHFQPDSLGPTTAMTMGGATLVHCGNGGDDRTSHIAIPTGNALTPTINAALGSSLNSATIANIGATTQHHSNNGNPTTWPPTLWQYPTAAMPALEPVGFPQLSVGLQGGLQLVRDPSTGHLLLIHAADGLNSADQMQHAVVWPNYSNHNGHSIGTQPLLLPPPPPPSLQLLSDMNGARLVLTDNKRKTQNNNVPIVKIEADCPSPQTTIIESSKALQTVTTMSSPLIQDNPLLTTLYYPHAPTAMVQINQSESTQCHTQHRNAFISKATSPVSCLTPPPEVPSNQCHNIADNISINVQDASNQTDAQEADDEQQNNDNNFKQEQPILSCYQQSNNATVNSVSSSGKPQVSLQPYNLVAKIDKSENTPISIPIVKNINSTATSLLKNDTVNTVDQTIESVISCRAKTDIDNNDIVVDNNDDNDDDNVSLNVDENSEDRVSRIGSRMIEITEENCDSFHENLEFFGRRRDPIEQHRRPIFTEELLNKEKMLEEKRREEEMLNEKFELNDNQDSCIENEKIDVTEDSSTAVTSSLECQNLDNIKTVLSQNKNEINHQINLDTTITMLNTNEENSQLSVKSFDMPTIDFDDDIQTKKNIKNSKQENIEINNTNNELKNDQSHNIDNKQNNNDNKKIIINDKLHPGIENVVEKLKKNAAAAKHDNESSVINNDNDKIAKNNTEIPRAIAHCQPRIMENGLKKRILRSCELEYNLEKLKNNQLSLTTDTIKTSENSNDNNHNLKLTVDVVNDDNNDKNDEKISSSSLKIIEDSSMIISPKKYNPDIVNSSPPNSTLTSKALEKSKNVINSTTTPTKNRVDLSGLELLSNSIAELEHIKSSDPNSSEYESLNSPIKETNEIKQNENNNNNEVDSPLGLLCALAEQRFMEEVGDNDVPQDSTEDVSHAGRLLLNLGKTHDKSLKRKYSTDDIVFKYNKKLRKNDKKICEFEDGDADDDFTDSDTELTMKNNKNKLFNDIIKRQNDENILINNENKKNWPHINTVERNVRNRLSDMQKMYKDKQNELLNNINNNNNNNNNNNDEKLRKLSTDYEDTDKLLNLNYDNNINVINTNITTPIIDNTNCNLNLTKLNEPQSHIKLLDNIPSIPIPVTSFTKKINSSHDENDGDNDDDDDDEDDDDEEEDEDEDDEDDEDDDEDDEATILNDNTSSPSSTLSSPKKRKVGRPRKCIQDSKSANIDNTTKNELLNTKNKLNYKKLTFNNNTGIKNQKRIKKSHKLKKLNINNTATTIKQKPLHNKNVISAIIAEKEKLNNDDKQNNNNKLKPKLKAEVKLKNWNNEYENEEWNNTIIDKTNNNNDDDNDDDNNKKTIDDIKKINNNKIIKKKKHKSTSSSPSRRKLYDNDNNKKLLKRRRSIDCKDCKECMKIAKYEKTKLNNNINNNNNNIINNNNNNKCKLTSEHLEIDKMRVLTAIGGLFYAGILSAVQSPDIYSITLDGERGNRPHIHSREEILKDAIVEICPKSTDELPPGTRLCAYWSQQYRCLYPGTSVEPSDPDSELDDKFVSVEFDDGDSGRISLDDIRLLQPDYPVVEYDPNPLLTLGKRKRQVSSSTDDKRPSDLSIQSINYQNKNSNELNNVINTKIINNKNDDKLLDDYKERKRLKKRRRDKLKRLQESQDGKKKHKKHKCCDEHRKHKHRKHRKHKHRHNHHGSFSDGSHNSGVESCKGQNSDEENIIKTTTKIIDNKKNINLQLCKVNDKIDDNVINEIDNIDNNNKKIDKKNKTRERQESSESRSKIAAFLPARQLWGWSGKGYRRPGAKGRAKKQFFKAIQRGGEAIKIGDSAVFLSTGRPDRPYIGRIESMWETSSSNMIVKVKWFYHPEETVGCPSNLKYPGALFESPHMDENDVQTISHKCEVLPLSDYTEKLGKEPHRYLTIYDNNDIYYLAGYYDPTTYLLTMQPGVV
ncbi:hypothetical protein HCN44_007044 [Aphidius gifuensis]|uniref:BAH domain-containing protein n=1 Tax=Aphidius gifuensis TaxID=684658 RepID=A0A834Y1K8_APHGI|nr:uncharacterized protein PF11_0213 isoform X2 [Aphidius gifuensis]KAF7995937.1 hypothetical protein HCN44_007044 [Aphidius gifuensis]